MYVSEGFGGFHDSQPCRFKDVTSAPFCYHSTINLTIQDPELVRNSLSGFLHDQNAKNQVIPAILTLSDVIETASKRG